MNTRSTQFASLALVCACLGGCPDDAGSDPACVRPFGGYDVAFEALDGRCGALATRSVRINGTPLLIQKFAERDVETEISVEGCTVAITQITRSKQGIPTEQLRGQGLTVRDDGTIVGVVTGTLYDDVGQESCSSDYQATLTPNGVIESGEGVAGSGGSSGGAFSEQHAEEIHKDCIESVNCLRQRDEQVEDNPILACVADSARALDSDEQRQATFLANFERCKQFIGCNYFDCAVSGVSTGYGASQAQAIRMKCEAESSCRAEAGMPDASPEREIDSCVVVVTGLLDAYTESQRASWEAALQTCSMLTSCELARCSVP